MCMLSCFSPVRLFVTPWTIVLQVPLSMRFSRQEYWSGLPFSPPGDPPHPGIQPCLLSLLHWQPSSLPLAPSWRPLISYRHFIYFILYLSQLLRMPSFSYHTLLYSFLLFFSIPNSYSDIEYCFLFEKTESFAVGLMSMVGNKLSKITRNKCVCVCVCSNSLYPSYVLEMAAGSGGQSWVHTWRIHCNALIKTGGPNHLSWKNWNSCTDKWTHWEQLKISTTYLNPNKNFCEFEGKKSVI